jgi:hypothetical protein
MNKTDELIQLCQQHKMYVQIAPNRIFVVLGEYYGLGSTLAEAIENWRDSVEKSGIVDKVEKRCITK